MAPKRPAATSSPHPPRHTQSKTAGCTAHPGDAGEAGSSLPPKPLHRQRRARIQRRGKKWPRRHLLHLCLSRPCQISPPPKCAGPQLCCPWHPARPLPPGQDSALRGTRPHLPGEAPIGLSATSHPALLCPSRARLAPADGSCSGWVKDRAGLGAGAGSELSSARSGGGCSGLWPRQQLSNRTKGEGT